MNFLIKGRFSGPYRSDHSDINITARSVGDVTVNIAAIHLLSLLLLFSSPIGFGSFSVGQNRNQKHLPFWNGSTFTQFHLTV